MGIQSRRDQVQAQSYVLGRLTSALVLAEPEAAESPHRRTLVGTVAGLLVAALVVAGFAVFGLLRPGGATSWRKPGTLVIEKETGSRYVLVDDRLRPVLNYSSAVLLFGEAPKTASVSAASLRSVPRGQPLGIVAAPEALPRPGMLGNDVAWSVCALAGRDQAGTLSTATILALNRNGIGEPLGNDEGLVVRAVDGESFLIWRARRYRLAGSWLGRLFGYDEPRTTVEAAWLDQVPAGPDIGPVTVPGRGERGPTIDGRPSVIGQHFVARVAGGVERHYVLQRDGLSPLTAVGVAVVSSDPDTARTFGPGLATAAALSAAALAELRTSSQRSLPAGLPETPPTPAAAAGPGRIWCTRWSGGSSTVAVATQAPAAGMAPVTDATGIARTKRTAAAMSVAPGLGGLVRVGRPGQAPGAAYYLVTDAGIKYPLSGAGVAEVLGYPPQTATVVPGELLDLLPTGPLLDPDLARR